MVKEVNVKGFSDFISQVDTLSQQDKKILCLFCGDKDASGKSWCPDCVTKEPIVREALNSLSSRDNLVFLYCMVGDRDYWKDRSNDFRLHKDLKLTGVPTLMIWGRPNEKLVEDQITADSVSMFLDD